MLTKKLATKRTNLERPLKKQILWFIGLYLSSILAIGLFHEFTKWFVEIIK